MKKLRLGLIGVGQMGTRIIQLAPERGHTITAEFKGNHPFTEERMVQARDRVDVWIDFSHASITEKVVSVAAKHNLKVVIGTTGWYDQLDAFQKKTEKSEAGIIWASNFSTGVYTFRKIVEYTASIMSKLKAYDVSIHEIHHNEKRDAPSGTAKTLADTLLKHYQASGLKNKVTPLAPGDTSISKDTIYISSSRVGHVVGVHEISFDSAEDAIFLSHEARNRNGLALGAIRAAEWISTRKGFHDIDAFFADLMEGQE
ncbi:MAG: 4-hydroxy-tetrahydrodipicolinate reductase [Bacteroidetes bacterium]|nr:4-hydroxy-tetrahydrodipicolinate reductase [Bacteroidota bacterium]